MSESLFPCVSCGFLMFSGEPGTYEICQVCDWEDDPVQLAHPGSGGANQYSLIQSQQTVLQRFPLDVTQVGAYARDPQWRPLLPSEMHSPQPPHDGLSYFEAAATVEPVYYWLR